MNLPLPTGSGNIHRQLRLIRDELRRGRQQRSANILTSVTTGGTLRRPIVGAADTSRKKPTARWA